MGRPFESARERQTSAVALTTKELEVQENELFEPEETIVANSVRSSKRTLSIVTVITAMALILAVAAIVVSLSSLITMATSFNVNAAMAMSVVIVAVVALCLNSVRR